MDTLILQKAAPLPIIMFEKHRETKYIHRLSGTTDSELKDKWNSYLQPMSEDIETTSQQDVLILI